MPSGIQKTDHSRPKMFRCELCCIRLPYSEKGLEQHLASRNHKHMKILLDYGLWPGGSDANIEVRQIEPKIYQFSGNGNILCGVCGVVMRGATALLQHQMEALHVAQIRTRALHCKIPRILFCEPCDIVVGKSIGMHGSHVYDNHVSSGAHQAAAEAKQQAISKQQTAVLPLNSGCGNTEPVLIGFHSSDGTKDPDVSPRSDSEATRESACSIDFASLPDESVILQEMVGRLNKTFLVHHGLASEHLSALEVPWMNEELKNGIIQKELIVNHHKSLLHAETMGAQPPGTASSLLVSRKHIEEVVTEVERKAKIKYIKKNKDIRQTIWEDILSEQRSTQQKHFGKTLADGKPKGFPFPSLAASNVKNLDETAVVTPASGAIKREMSDAEFVHDSAVVPQTPSHQVLPSTLPQTVQSVPSNNSLSPEEAVPSGRSMNVRMLLGRLLQLQENLVGVDGSNMDPIERIRTALLNQLMAERLETRPSQNLMSDLIDKLTDRKSESSRIMEVSACETSACGSSISDSDYFGSQKKMETAESLLMNLSGAVDQQQLKELWQKNVASKTENHLQDSQAHGTSGQSEKHTKKHKKKHKKHKGRSRSRDKRHHRHHRCRVRSESKDPSPNLSQRLENTAQIIENREREIRAIQERELAQRLRERELLLEEERRKLHLAELERRVVLEHALEDIRIRFGVEDPIVKLQELEQEAWQTAMKWQEEDRRREDISHSATDGRISPVIDADRKDHSRDRSSRHDSMDRPKSKERKHFTAHSRSSGTHRDDHRSRSRSRVAGRRFEKHRRYSGRSSRSRK